MLNGRVRDAQELKIASISDHNPREEEPQEKIFGVVLEVQAAFLSLEQIRQC